MEEKLKEFTNKQVDINCGAGAIFRGTIEEVSDDLVIIKDEHDRRISLAIKKIIAVTEYADPINRPGFII
jgi:hypothetical protein